LIVRQRYTGRMDGMMYKNVKIPSNTPFPDITEGKEAEEEMRVKNNVIASSINAVAIADLEGNLAYVNHAFLRMWGYADEKEVLGKNAVEFWQIAEEPVEVMQVAMYRGGWIGELAAKRKDGSSFDVQVSASVARDEAGKPICRLGSFIDITERKQVEELNRTLASSSSVGVYIVQEGEFRFVNPEFQKYTGYTEDELLGMDSLELVHPEDRKGVRKNAVEMLKGKRLSPYEFRAIGKGGETIWAIETVTSVHYKGKRAALGNFMDITERKRVEEELKSSEEQLRILFEFAPDAYYLNDLKGNFVDGNKAAEEITGYKRDELIGKNFLKLKLLSPGQILKAAALLAQNALGQATGPDEFTLTRKDGTQVQLEIRAFPVKIKGKTLVLGIAHDITERKRMEQELRESEQKYRTLFENLNDAAFLADVETGRILDTNKQGEMLVGRTREEIIGMHQSELHPPGMANEYRQRFATHVHKGRAA